MILILGGSGFLGKNIIEVLSKLGLDYYAPSSKEINLLEHDLANSIDHEGIEGVINCAAVVGGIHFNISNSDIILERNLMISLNIQKLLRKLESNGVFSIQIGSTCMYPEHTGLPYEVENIWNGFPVQETGDYGIAKRIQLMLNNRLPPNYDTLDIIPVNLYGKHDNYIGPMSHVIPALIERFHLAKIQHSPSVNVWGSPIITREFLFAEDLANFIGRWIISKNRKSLTLNAGSGVETNMKDLAECIKKVVGYKGCIQFDDTKPIGNKRRLVNSLEFREDTPVTSLTEGLKKTYEDYLSRIR